MNEFNQLLSSLTLDEATAKIYRALCDAEADPNAFAENFVRSVNALLASKPREEVRELLTLHAARIRAMVLGDSAAHKQALDGLMAFLKTHTAA